MNFKVIKTDLVGWVLACNLLVEDLKGKKNNMKTKEKNKQLVSIA